jgi:hypothetical protein
VRIRLPSWFWLLLCLASFSSSALVWGLEQMSKPHSYPIEATADAQPAELPAAEPMAQTTDRSDPTVAADLPVPESAPAVARAEPPQPLSTAPGEVTLTTKVLRCVVRGQVTYVAVTSACADGSEGKITVLPR